MKKICDRCEKTTSVMNLSRLNFDFLCTDCKKYEEKHPLYEWAKHVEHVEVQKGIETEDEVQKNNHFNFSVFDGLTWAEIEKNTPEILFELQKVLKNNQKQISKVDGNLEEAINLYGFTYNGKKVLNPFKDENDSFPVHPVEYYGNDLLEELANEYSTSFVALFDE